MSETATAVTVYNGVTLTSSMTAEERFIAVAKATPGVTVHQPEQQPQFHTEETARHFDRQEAAARIDRKAEGALTQAFSALTAHQRETFRHVYEADLRELYAGRKSPGNLNAALDKEVRDKRVQDALNKALAENKSPEELKQILDGALTGKPQARDSSGKFAPAPNAVGPQGTPAERAAEEADKDLPARWEQAHQNSGAIGADGLMEMRHINPAALSGYTLPVFLENQVVHRGVFARLAQARAAGITQAQVDAFLRAELVAVGKLKA